VFTASRRNKHHSIVLHVPYNQLSCCCRDSQAAPGAAWSNTFESLSVMQVAACMAAMRQQQTRLSAVLLLLLLALGWCWHVHTSWSLSPFSRLCSNSICSCSLKNAVDMPLSTPTTIGQRPGRLL